MPIKAAAEQSLGEDQRKWLRGVVSSRFSVDRSSRQLGQRLISVLLLGEGLIEELDRISHVEVASPGLERNLIMLDRLRRSQEPGIERGRVFVIVHDFLASRRPSIASHFLPRAGLPRIWKICSRRSIWPSVSS